LFHTSANTPAIVALLQVILIDLVLAGDNAVVIGMAAARIPKPQRRKVIFWGLAAAVILRMVLAVATATILELIGLMFAGGILLLWVSWRLYRDLHPSPDEAAALHTISGRDHDEATEVAPLDSARLRRAILRIVVADISMSLDNVLAVAGAAMDHVWVLAIGLILSIALMGVAAAMIANLLSRHPWLSYAGLIIVVYVALRMIYFGGLEILHARDQASRSSSAVASSLVLNRGYAMPSGSAASMARSSTPSDFRPFVWAAAINPSAS
jgi:YjbE family integral membrane protein